MVYERVSRYQAAGCGPWSRYGTAAYNQQPYKAPPSQCLPVWCLVCTAPVIQDSKAGYKETQVSSTFKSHLQAYAMLQAVLPAPFPSASPQRCYVSNMAVAREFRRRGAATVLLQSCARLGAARAVPCRRVAVMLSWVQPVLSLAVKGLGLLSCCPGLARAAVCHERSWLLVPASCNDLPSKA